jgi:hypothetical protein
MLLDHNATAFVDIDNHNGKINTKLDLVLMPEANLLMNVSQYHMVQELTKQHLNFIKDLRTPVALLGIGAQVKFLPDGTEHRPQEITLPSEQKQFMETVLRGGFATVRGKFTKAILDSNGLTGALPLGCPSLTINRRPDLGELLEQKWRKVVTGRDSKIKLAVALPKFGAMEDSRTAQMLVKILKLFPKSEVVIQQPSDFSVLHLLHTQEGFFLPYERFRYFYHPVDWISSLKSFDLALSFRIHGGMAAIAAEVPTIVISTDHRIKEMAETMSVVTKTITEMKNEFSGDLFSFLAPIKVNGKEFDCRRAAITRVYREKFQQLGAPLHPDLVFIAENICL